MRQNFNLHKSPWLLTALLTTVSLVGCGGGGSGTNGGGGIGSDPSVGIAAGSVDLGTVISNNGSSSSTALSDAVQQFSNSYAIKPSGKAAVGYVAALGAIDASAMATLVGTSTPFLAKTAGAMVLWKLSPQTSGLVPSLKKPTDALPFSFLTGVAKAAQTRSTSPTPARVIAELKTVEADLVKMKAVMTDANIQGLESDPLVISYTANGTVTSIKVGTAEGYALRAAIEALQGSIDVLLAYNLDYGTTDFNANFGTTYGGTLASQGFLTSAGYLPAAPFLNLNTDGAARLQAWGTTWISAANDATSAVTTLQARTSTGWAFNLANYNASDLPTALGDISQFKAAITAPIPNVSVTNNSGVSATLTIDLTAWMGGTPPATLRAFFPTIQAGQSAAVSAPLAGSIADTTYGGLIPGGVPSDVLYNRVIETDLSVGTVDAEAFAFFY